MLKDYKLFQFSHQVLYDKRQFLWSPVRQLDFYSKFSADIKADDTTHLMCPQEVWKACYLQNSADVKQL